MVKLFFKWLAQYRLQRQILKANKMAKLTGYRYYIIYYKGKPLIYAKKDLKRMIAMHKFNKGFGAQDIDRIAIYKTP